MGLGLPLPAHANKLAYVVGNGAYQFASALANPTNDAREVGSALRALGFDVIEKTDLTRVTMAIGLQAFLSKANSASIVVIFYAGHGIQVDGRNYMVPVDAKLETLDAVNGELIEVDDLLSRMSSSNRANIVILDACRDNPLARKLLSGVTPSRSVNVQSGFAAYTSVKASTR